MGYILQIGSAFDLNGQSDLIADQVLQSLDLVCPDGFSYKKCSGIGVERNICVAIVILYSTFRSSFKGQNESVQWQLAIELIRLCDVVGTPSLPSVI